VDIALSTAKNHAKVTAAMKVAIIHDHLLQLGGGEKVTEALARIFPEAPIFTLLYDEARMGKMFPKDRVRPSFIQKFPFSKTKYQWYLPFMPSATENYDLRSFDLVISSSSAFAKGVIIHPGTRHICYCHTPTRYLWSDSTSYVQSLPRNRLVKLALQPLLSHLRVYDRLSADRVHNFIANSKFVADRIKTYYQRNSEVIPPPIEIEKYSPTTGAKTYYLTGGRLVSYKRFDLTVQAFSAIGIPLKIFGVGPELKKLRAMAKSNIEFVGHVDDSAKAELYRNAIAFIHPQVEDFGITAVESMASGRPVIAYGVGGAAETVIPGVTGEWLEEQTWECLANTIIHFKPEAYNTNVIRKHAEEFGLEKFREKILKIVNAEMRKDADRS